MSIVAWSDIPDGVPRPIYSKSKKQVKKLNLTGDRPLTLKDARKLKRWWDNNLWSANIDKEGRFYKVTAIKEVYV